MGKTVTDFKMFDDENVNPIPAVSDRVFMAKTEHYTPYTTSREIAAQFGVEHKNVLQSIRKIIKDDTTGAAAKSFFETTYTNSQNKQQPEFYVNQSGFQLLCLTKMANNPDIRIKFNTMFNAYNERNRNDLNVALARIKELEANGADPAKVPRELYISNALKMANDIINEQKAEIEAMQPDVEYAKAVSSSTDCILIRQLAEQIAQALVKEGFKKHKVGQNNLFIWMRKNGYLKKGNARDQNLPTKRCMEMGLMEIKTTPVEHKSLPGETWNSRTPLITAKGARYFTTKILNLYREGGRIDEV